MLGEAFLQLFILRCIEYMFRNWSRCTHDICILNFHTTVKTNLFLQTKTSVTEIFCTGKSKSNNFPFVFCVSKFHLLRLAGSRKEKYTWSNMIKQDHWSDMIKLFFSVCIDMIRHDFVAPNPIVIFSWSIWASHKPIVAPGEEMYKQLTINYSPVWKNNVCWSFCSNDVALYWIQRQIRNVATARQHKECWYAIRHMWSA